MKRLAERLTIFCFWFLKYNKALLIQIIRLFRNKLLLTQELLQEIIVVQGY